MSMNNGNVSNITNQNQKTNGQPHSKTAIKSDAMPEESIDGSGDPCQSASLLDSSHHHSTRTENTWWAYFQRRRLKCIAIIATLVIAALFPRLGLWSHNASRRSMESAPPHPVLHVLSSYYNYYILGSAVNEDQDADDDTTHGGHSHRTRKKHVLCLSRDTSSSSGIHKAVIFDAGSTGSRVHVYSFRCGARSLSLDGERFEYITPGLSHYAANASAAADSLRPLLDAALEEVTLTAERQRTPILLRATAGLRLLPGQAADTIIAEVAALLAESQFRINLIPKHSVDPIAASADPTMETNDAAAAAIPAAAILSGLDEGIYAWFTVNFLLGQLHDPTRAGVTLDLGGGSTQITFTPRERATLDTSPAGHVTKRAIDGELEDMYTTSYLGYGLMSARKAILAAEPSSHIVPVSEDATITAALLAWLPYWPSDNPTRATDRIIIDAHPCFANSRPKNWTYDGILYMINHQLAVIDNQSDSIDQQEDDEFQRCMTLATDFVHRGGIHGPGELAVRDIYGLSYFFDRSRDAGLIDAQSDEQTITLQDIYTAAQVACSRDANIAVTDRIKSFLCLDLAYIHAYLHTGLGLPADKTIHLVKKIDGIETSWALGAALELLQHL